MGLYFILVWRHNKLEMNWKDTGFETCPDGIFRGFCRPCWYLYSPKNELESFSMSWFTKASMWMWSMLNGRSSRYNHKQYIRLLFKVLLGFIVLFFTTRETTLWTVFVQERFGFWSAQLCLPEESTSRELILYLTTTSPPVLSSTSTELVSLYSAVVLARAFLVLEKAPRERRKKDY